VRLPITAVQLIKISGDRSEKRSPVIRMLVIFDVSTLNLVARIYKRNLEIIRDWKFDATVLSTEESRFENVNEKARIELQEATTPASSGYLA